MKITRSVPSFLVLTAGLVLASGAARAAPIVADCDLDACAQGKTKMFDFAAHRRPEAYGPITGQAGATPPA